MYLLAERELLAGLAGFCEPHGEGRHNSRPVHFRVDLNRLSRYLTPNLKSGRIKDQFHFDLRGGRNRG